MEVKGSIRAVNSSVERCRQQYNQIATVRSPKDLAIKRFFGKFEEPNIKRATERRNSAWERWINKDCGLAEWSLLGPNWAKARFLMLKYLRGFRMGELTFTNGSSFEPLGNRLSIACKLEVDWTITQDCFDLFAKYSYWHRALKHACKKRFAYYCKTHHYDLRAVNRTLWRHFRSHPEVAYQVYRFKLDCVVTYVGGNRYSTVPKNNEKDRSICLEPLCNMLVQRAIGLGIRRCLKDNLGIDLDTLADVHRGRISDPTVATIDLADCSDAISVKLIRYLLPSRVLSKVLASRSDMTLGPDDMFYYVKKVSSMGNGFTFDLMTIVLTALTKAIDDTASVFGDDIICRNAYAEEIISSLQKADFVINDRKTLVYSEYRESCGAHFMDGYGYVTSFDFKWLASPSDLIVACNKLYILSTIYGEPFASLYASVWSCVPPTLLGVAVSKLTVNTSRPPSYELSSYIRYGPEFDYEPRGMLLRSLRRKLSKLHINGRISIAYGVFEQQLRPKNSLTASQWSLFFQYLQSGRVSRKVPRSVNKSTLVVRVGGEIVGPANALLP